jgi:dipeptidyl-peptidase 4
MGVDQQQPPGIVTTHTGEPTGGPPGKIVAMTDSFPRQQAKTQGFSLGAPRSFQISPDGSRVAFLRSQGGDDPVTCLWVLDTGTGRERLAADPATIGAGAPAVTDQEKAIRERTRERASGIVGFATDAAFTAAAFTLAGRVYLADLAGEAPPRAVPAQAPAFDARPDPTGRRVAYVCAGALRVTDLAAGEDTEIIGPGDQPGLTYGLAEFIAAEEMGRVRGYWWAPDGTALLVARVDNTPVQRWYITDPANPGRPPAEVAYPSAGTANADVSLLLAGLDGSQAPLEWDRAAFPYLVTVNWDRGAPLIVVQSRDQQRMRLLSADPARSVTAVLREDTDDRWLDIVQGAPARTSDGRIVWTADAGGARRLLVASPEELSGGGAAPVTPADLQVREILDVDADTVLFSASPDEPTVIGLWIYGPGGLENVTDEPGVHHGWRAGGTTVISSRSLGRDSASVRVVRDGSADLPVTSLAERPSLPSPRPDIFAAASRGIRTALLLPSWHEPGSGKLPVLLDPYGGPHGQRVVAARAAFLTSQWLADQGFAVVVADGRGTPGRGPEWDRAVWHDLADPVLEDQVEALHAAAGRCGDLDTSRVAIRGWSFGGYLAALAVLRRPEVFHAAIVGAPVTDQRFYDTHYTERYLGRPDDYPEVYDRCSPITDAERIAARARAGGGGVTHRPMMIIHGLADDNVVVAHSLRLSSALLSGGYPHTVLPLSGVTHLASQEEVAENLLLLQVDFLRRALGLTGQRG